jgi:hypothetical protein
MQGFASWKPALPKTKNVKKISLRESNGYDEDALEV